MTSQFSLNPVAVEAAAKAVIAYVKPELEYDPDVYREEAEAAIQAWLTAEGARMEVQPRREI